MVNITNVTRPAMPTNLTGPLDLAQFVNTSTAGFFGIGLVCAVWLLTFLFMGLYKKEAALLTASFTAWLTAVLLGAGGLVNEWVIGLTFVATVASAVLAYLANK